MAFLKIRLRNNEYCEAEYRIINTDQISGIDLDKDKNQYVIHMSGWTYRADINEAKQLFSVIGVSL